MKYKDYYEILEVERGATQDEIKSSYRQLARKYHPDVSKESDAEDRFKELGEAYEVLKDPEKRAAYDQLGSGYQQNQDFSPPPDWDAGFEFSGGGFTDSDSHDFSDFFEELFSRGHRSRGFGGGGGPFGEGASGFGGRGDFRARGNDSHAKVMLDLEDSFHGATPSITLRVPTVTDDGHVTTANRVLKVRIPKGVVAGQEIRLAGQGNSGHGGGQAGDLYLEIDFAPHPIYRPEGTDVYVDLPVTPWEAALGAKVKVPTPNGVVSVTVPKESKGGETLRLKGQGIPTKTPGDLYAVLTIALPPADSKQARQIYEEMGEKLDFNPRERLGV